MTCMSLKSYIGRFEPSAKQLKAVLASVRGEEDGEIPFSTTMVDVDDQGNLITAAPPTPKPEPVPIADPEPEMVSESEEASEPEPEPEPDPEPEPRPRVRAQRSRRRSSRGDA